MTSIITGKECDRCRVAKVVLSSRAARAGSTPQEGVIQTRVWESVISINAHQVMVPIIGTNNFARLSLEVGGVDLNGFNDEQTPKYALGVPLRRAYAGDTVGIYHWPSDMFPIYQGQKPYRALGQNWNYRWTLPDGTDYPLGVNDHWIAEFFILQKCYEPVEKF